MSGQKSKQGAAAKQAPLISSRQRRRLERRSVLERITSNGTIAAVVMIVAAVAAVAPTRSSTSRCTNGSRVRSSLA